MKYPQLVLTRGGTFISEMIGPQEFCTEAGRTLLKFKHEIIISLMENFRRNAILSKSDEENENDLKAIRHVPLDYAVLVRDFPDDHFKKCLENHPDLMLSCMGLAMHQLVNEQIDHPHKIHARLYNFEPVVALSSLKSALIGKLVSIRGTVVRVGSIKPIVISMKFSCSRCLAQFKEFFTDGKYKIPEKCATPGCHSKIFDPLPHTSETEDWQRIKVQELTIGTDPGRVPRTIEVELTEDQVDSCVPGDVITICGQVKLSGTQTNRGRVKAGQSMYVCYIDANCVGNLKQGDTGKLDLMQWSLPELQGFEKICRTRDPFALIVKSICPSIYGNHLVKAGLALAMFSGAQKKAGHLGIRGDIHVLLVGDPGLGKSQLLTAVCELAPRGVYVCGSYSSTSGLTVTLLRDPSSGDYALEAGALVLGDQGICCIDEFDKMKHEHQALLEAMEQQSVSIAKAGIVCNLPARTAVIAAANPCGGHYNKAKTVAENLKISAPLLSRFDLVFILLDKPDQERDLLLSEHVMSLHASNTNLSPSQRTQQSATNASYFSSATNTSSALESDLLTRLINVPDKPAPIIPQLLRKYIGYAKKYIPTPEMSEEACVVLQEFYISLRESQSTTDYTPITTRQIESMIRLAEARARLELRDKVTKQDAEDVVQIMRQSLKEAFEDDFQCFDFRKTSGMSSAKQQRAFVALLNAKSQKSFNVMFTTQELRQIAHEAHINVPSFDDFLETLNYHGYLLRQGGGTFKLGTV